MTELEIQQEVEKVKKKILENRWFDKPTQINTRILVRFMGLSNKNTKPVYIDDLRKICSDIRDFNGNLASMKTEARNNNANGKFFEEYERNTISLWQPVADFICNEYDKWLGGGTIINAPIPPAIITQTTITTRTIPPLNQILYGPPGTGKTYNTINKALEILGEQTEGKDRAELKAKFDEYWQNGQIEFVTFHQSFSYEEFVEGIKPNIENENVDMTYEIKDGIFKEINQKALSNYQAHKDSLATLSQQQTSTKELFQAFAQNLQEQLASAENGIDFNTPSLSTKMRISKIFYFKNEEAKSIAISTPNSSSNQVLKRDIVLRDYEKFKSGEISNYKDIKPTYESLAQWHGNAIYYFALYEKLAEFEKTYSKPQAQNVDKVVLKPYILIIDEINRGNISKILGELITLIEPSKRIGASEELRVTLPYSNDSFGVPSNLYIIGTMNTADRSIALLDTALRRRFEFVEMMPDSSQLKRCGDIDLAQLLDKMNERIEFLLDREHTIGHSFFIGIGSLDKLREVFKLKIIPLLQEYFYDDYAKIDAVLNYNKMVESKSMGDLGVVLSDDFVDNEKRVYRITDSSAWNATTFTKIYEEITAQHPLHSRVAELWRGGYLPRLKVLSS